MTALTLALPICDRCHRPARPALCSHCTAVLGQTSAIDQLRHAVEAATGRPLLDPDPDDLARTAARLICDQWERLSARNTLARQVVDARIWRDTAIAALHPDLRADVEIAARLAIANRTKEGSTR